MTEVEKVYTLKVMPPFDQLSDADLTLIARVAETREFAEGSIVHAEAMPFHRLYLLISGSWRGATGPMPRILGVGSLVAGLPFPEEVVAGPEGARCLTIRKSHFDTIANEIPELLLGFIALPPAAPGEVAPFR